MRAPLIGCDTRGTRVRIPRRIRWWILSCIPPAISSGTDLILPLRRFPHFLSSFPFESMVRILSHPRIRDAFPFHRLIAIRERSHARIIEVDLAAAADAGEGEGEGEGEVDVDIISLRRLEDAVRAISVRRAAPDWLPFVPGSSYWFPPPRRTGGVVNVVKKLANPLTEEEIMSLTTVRGWPSSSYFVEGISPHSVKKNMKKASAQSDDED